VAGSVSDILLSGFIVVATVHFCVFITSQAKS